jgi:hypothetical protein
VGQEAGKGRGGQEAFGSSTQGRGEKVQDDYRGGKGGRNETFN